MINYDVLYADKEWVRRTFKNDDEARELLKYNRDNGQIPIVKMINCSNEKEVTL